MVETVVDEPLALALLNSTPVVSGEPTDDLATDEQAALWAADHGGTGTPAEAAHLRRARDLLQEVVRGHRPGRDLAEVVDGAVRVPRVGDDGVRWHLDAEDDRRLAIRAALAWADVVERWPGRLRPCANEECRLFLLDRSRAGTARWCSMASCGNRMKARRHHRRERTTD